SCLPDSSRRQAETAFQLHHCKARPRRLAALVALVDPGARQRLLLVLDGKNAEADRQMVLESEALQPMRAFRADMLVMRGLAADDAAQRRIAVIGVLRRRGEADRGRDFERAG